MSIFYHFIDTSLEPVDEIDMTKYLLWRTLK